MPSSVQYILFRNTFKQFFSPQPQYTSLANLTDYVPIADKCDGWKGFWRCSLAWRPCLTSLKFNTDGGRWLESIDRLEHFGRCREQIYEQGRVILKQGAEDWYNSKKGQFLGGEIPEITVREWAEVGENASEEEELELGGGDVFFLPRDRSMDQWNSLRYPKQKKVPLRYNPCESSEPCLSDDRHSSTSALRGWQIKRCWLQIFR